MKRIITFSNKRPAKTIRDIGPRAKSIDNELIADRLGAEDELATHTPTSSLSLYSLRESIFALLTSNGGRPGLVGITRRQKIPISDQDWDELKQIAREEFSTKKVSPGQIAAMFIKEGLAQLRKEAHQKRVISAK